MRIEAMNVLSIDWDFFQIVSKEDVSYYPEGIDLGGEVSAAIWRKHYESYPELAAIPLAEQEYRLLKELLIRQKQSVPVMIANSHVLAYDFILDNLEPEETVVMTNIDMHQDIVNDNAHMDCGNWIGYLFRNGYMEKVKVTGTPSLRWVHNPVSFQVYGIDKYLEDPAGGNFGKVITAIDGGTTIAPLLNTQYDLIFLARSDMWSPPHLDTFFCKIIGLCKKHFSTVCVEEGIDSLRRITPIKYE